MAGPSESLRLRLQKAAEKMGLDPQQDTPELQTDFAGEKKEKEKAKNEQVYPGPC